MIEENVEPTYLPSGWTLSSLDDVAEIIRGISFKKDQRTSEHEEGRVACLRTTNVQKQVEWGDLWFVPKELVKKQTQLLQPNDVLISMSNSLGLVGKVAQASMIPHEATIGAFISIIRVVQGLDPVFFYNLLASYEVQSAIRRTASTTTNISNISNASLNRISLKMPPLNEQHRIVTKIEELFTNLDAGVEAIKKVQEQIKRYRQAVLKYAFEGKLTAEWRGAHKDELEPASVLLERIRDERKKNMRGKYKEPPAVDTTDLPELPDGWIWVNFQQIVDGSRNAMKAGPFGSALKKEYYVKSGYKIYGQEQVIRGDPHYGDYYIDEKRYRTLESCTVQPGDVLISLVGTIGKVMVLSEDIEPGILNPRLVKITLDQAVAKPRYIKAFIESGVVRHFFSLGSHGGTMDILNLTILKGLPIPLPPVVEQGMLLEEIERRLSISDAIDKMLEQGLQQSNRLRQSILKRAFEGKLVPQDPSDEPAYELLERIREEREKESAGAKKAKSNKRS